MKVVRNVVGFLLWIGQVITSIIGSSLHWIARNVFMRASRFVGKWFYYRTFTLARRKVMGEPMWKEIDLSLGMLPSDEYIAERRKQDPMWGAGFLPCGAPVVGVGPKMAQVLAGDDRIPVVFPGKGKHSHILVCDSEDCMASLAVVCHHREQEGQKLQPPTCALEFARGHGWHGTAERFMCPDCHDAEEISPVVAAGA